MEQRSARLSPEFAVVLCGLVMVFAFSVITVLSGAFVYGLAYRMRPISEVVGWYMLTWAAFGVSIYMVKRCTERWLFVFILAVGLLLRILLFFSSPILEHDFYRYIWDGQVLKSGINPFKFAPRDLPLERLKPSPDQQKAADLVVARSAYREVKTIYPHAAQFVFWQNAMLWDWDLLGFRKTLLFYDILLVLLGALVLRQLGLSRDILLVFAWCPLILKEVTNSMHIDIVCAMFLTAFVLMILKGRDVWALLFLLFAAWVKITPLFLFPLVAAYLLRNGRKRQLFIGASLVLVLGLLSIWSLYWGNTTEPFSGLITFSRDWQTNSALQRLLTVVFTKLGFSQGGHIARYLLMGVFFTFIGWQMSRLRNHNDLFRACGNTLFLLFLVSPVGNPWYLLWLLPFFLDDLGVSLPAGDGAVLFCGQAASEQAIRVSCFNANEATGQECPPSGSAITLRKNFSQGHLVSPQLYWFALWMMTSLYYYSFALDYRGAPHVAYDYLQMVEYLPILSVLVLQWYRMIRDWKAQQIASNIPEF